jgi:hypothetical protein
MTDADVAIGLARALDGGKMRDVQHAIHLARHTLDVSLIKTHSDGSRTHTTPLILSMTRGRADLLHLLLEQGADPNFGVECGETPLEAAVRLGSTIFVAILIWHGADIQGDAVLAKASYHNQSYILRQLLQLRANRYPSAVDGTDVVNSAIQHGRVQEACDFIRHRFSVGTKTVTLAVQHNQPAVVRALINEGCPPEWFLNEALRLNRREILRIVFRRMRHPLDEATQVYVFRRITRYRRPLGLQLCLREGFDPRLYPEVMFIAVHDGRLSLVRMMLELGVTTDDVRIRVGNNIVNAAVRRCGRALPYLLQQCSDPNLRIRRTQPSLTLAMTRSDLEAAIQLVRGGVNPWLPYDPGMRMQPLMLIADESAVWQLQRAWWLYSCRVEGTSSRHLHLVSHPFTYPRSSHLREALDLAEARVFVT